MKRQGMPIALKDMLVEKPHAAVADTHGRRSKVVNVLSVQEVVRKLGFGDQVWGFAIELREQADFPDISLLSSFAFATELKRGNHLLTKWGHEISPFVSGRAVCVRRKTS